MKIRGETNLRLEQDAQLNAAFEHINNRGKVIYVSSLLPTSLKKKKRTKQQQHPFAALHRIERRPLN